VTPGGSLHRGWSPLKRIDNAEGFEINPAIPEMLRAEEVWRSDRYECTVRYMMPIPEAQWETAGSEWRVGCEHCNHWIRGEDQANVEGLMHKHLREAHGSRDGMIHLSIHANDRGPMRNWRHLQQIKNEVAGEDRTAVEIFPPEAELTDTANEYHLWVFPAGFKLPYGLGEEPLVSPDDADVEAWNRAPHKGQQEPWEPGLTTGRTDASKEARDRLANMKGDLA
jgi:hypothetical protein